MLLLVILFAILKIGFSICMFLQNRFTEDRSITDTFRSSRMEMFFKIGVLLNFTSLTGKHLCPTQVFSCEIREMFKNSFFHRTFPVAASLK